jgi:hypothetical protein
MHIFSGAQNEMCKGIIARAREREEFHGSEKAAAAVVAAMALSRELQINYSHFINST